MKIFFLSFLFLFVSCNGGGGGSSGENSAKVTTGGQITDEQIAKEYIQSSTQTLPAELQLTNQDVELINKEVSLTDEEINALNQLQ